MASQKKKQKKRRRRFPLIPAVCLLAVLILAGSAVHRAQEPEDGAAEKTKAARKVAETVKSSAQKKKPADRGGDTQDGAAASKERDWKLLLVNPWNALPEDYEIELAKLPDGHEVDARCKDDLLQMLADCRAAGLSPLICSAYRTMEYQEELYENKAQRLHDAGMGWEEAYRMAATVVAYPGTSEHQLGLAVDIVDETHQLLDTSQEDTAVQKWLIRNSWKYGFILRYPNDKSEITGIIYEPWHYRYVGRELAKEITEMGVCLEEYLEQME